MTPSTVTLSPDPAVAGKPLAVTVPGTTSAHTHTRTRSVLPCARARSARLSPARRLPRTTAAEAVSEGKIGVLVSYTGMPVYQTSVPLCDTVPCPVAPGPLTVRYSTTLPGIAPPVRTRLRLWRFGLRKQCTLV
jgi:hypothetical protein